MYQIHVPVLWYRYYMVHPRQIPHVFPNVYPNPNISKKKKKLHSIFTIKHIIVPSAYGLGHGGRNSRQLVGGSRYSAAPL